MGDFGEQTAVRAVDEGRYEATLSKDWEIWGPNGGYVAAIALRAVGAHVPEFQPAAFTCHFLSVAEFAAVEVRVGIARAAKRAVALHFTMHQGDRIILQGMAWFVRDVSGLEHDHVTPLTLPTPAQLRSVEELLPPDAPLRFAFWNNLEQKPIRWVNWEDRVAGPPEYRAWHRFRPRATFDDPVTDAARSLLLVDTMSWPAAVQAHDPDSLAHIAPTLDVSVAFHQAEPASEWLLADAVAPLATDGLIGYRTEVRGESGALLATGSGQMLCRPAPST